MDQRIAHIGNANVVVRGDADLKYSTNQLIVPGPTTGEQPAGRQNPQREKDEDPRPVRILLLGANPEDSPQLRQDVEAREIESKLRGSKHRERFSFHSRLAIRKNDLQTYLLDISPNIVQFSGHGRTGELYLEDGPVSADFLAQVFGALKGGIRCVILNACYTREQAEAIAAEIECVIGMVGVIPDSAAIDFSVSFYQALAYGENLHQAFKLGCAHLEREAASAELLLAGKGDPSEVFFVKEGGGPQ